MTRERSIRGRVAVVGVGETAYYKHGRAPESEFVLALQAILRACEDAGIDPARDRRLRLLQQRPQRALAPRRRPRHARSSASRTCSGAAAGAAARRAVGNAAAAVAAGSRTASSSSARWPRASSGASAPRAAGGKRVAARRRSRFPYGLMSPAQTFAMRVDATHARSRRAAGGAAGGGAGLVPSRPGEPACGDARPAADARRATTPRAGSSSRTASSTAAWRTTARRRSILVPRGTRAGPQADARLSPRRRAGHRLPQRGAACHNAPDYATLELHDGRRPASTRWPASGRRTSTWCRATRTSPAASS